MRDDALLGDERSYGLNAVLNEVHLIIISWHGVGTVGVVCGNLRALLLVVGSRISFFRFLIFHTKSYSFLSLYSAKLSILSEIARQSTYVRPYERVQRADSRGILSIGIPRSWEGTTSANGTANEPAKYLP